MGTRKPFIEKKRKEDTKPSIKLTEKQRELIESFGNPDEEECEFSSAFDNMLSVVSGDAIREKAHIIKQLAELMREKELLELQIAILEQKYRRVGAELMPEGAHDVHSGILAAGMQKASL